MRTLALLGLLGLSTLAEARDTSHALTWNLSVSGSPIGTRTVKVRYAKSDLGLRRILESYTQLDGNVGPIRVAYRQRLTAHAEGMDPASFHSVIDDNGSPAEIQGRWTPASWFVTTNIAGRARTNEFGVSKIDLSTADLMDPDSRVSLDRYERIRLLSAETGEVLEGPVQRLGHVDLQIGGTSVPVEQYAWTSAEGKALFFYSPDGWLVKYRMQMQGITVEGVLNKPPPGGVDDFPVAAGRPSVEIIDL